ncbi:MAG TPA: tripartite tricarboxylate transporter TctB family protein [Alphaproteobacteria bacterium]|nr:tripartite tricarboxylate transporter TctB family protein [Alphaproteobacteria bacterium]
MMRDLAGGLSSIALGAAYFYYATQIRTSALDDAAGPAGFPKVLAAIMIGFGLILAVQALIARASQRAKAGLEIPGESEGEERGDVWRGMLRAGGMLLLGILYLVLVPYAGYLVTVAALIFAVVLYQGGKFSWRLVAISIGGGVFLWLIFNVLLGIGLPAGQLGNLF